MMMMIEWQRECQNLKEVMIVMMMTTTMMLTTVIVTITMMKVRTVDRHELAVVLMCVLWIDMYRESVSASNVER